METRFKDIKPHHLFIIAGAIFFLALLLSILRIGELYTTLSDFGADYRTGLIFNFLIFIGGIVMLIGSIFLCRANLKKYGMVRSIALITVTGSIAFLGLFPLGINDYVHGVHRVFSTIFFIGAPIAMILFSTLFYRSNQTIFIVLSALGVIDIIQLVVFYNARQIMVFQWIGILITIAFFFILLRFSPDLGIIKDEFEELG